MNKKELLDALCELEQQAQALKAQLEIFDKHINALAEAIDSTEE